MLTAIKALLNELTLLVIDVRIYIKKYAPKFLTCPSCGGYRTVRKQEKLVRCDRCLGHGTVVW